MAKRLENWQRIDRLAMDVEKLARKCAKEMHPETANRLHEAFVVLRDAANRYELDARRDAARVEP